MAGELSLLTTKTLMDGLNNKILANVYGGVYLYHYFQVRTVGSQGVSFNPLISLLLKQ